MVENRLNYWNQCRNTYAARMRKMDANELTRVASLPGSVVGSFVALGSFSGSAVPETSERRGVNVERTSCDDA